MSSLSDAKPHRHRIIVDTDCGTDDLIAIIFLANCPEIDLVAVTTVHGLARAREGAENVRRVLLRLGKSHVPVYQGAEHPLSNSRHFPDDWRMQTENLDGVRLPVESKSPPTFAAQDFLATVFQSSIPTTIMALGPWTNLALAQRQSGRSPACQVSVFSMGGNFDSPGNVFAESIGAEVAPNAEWNFYLDPSAVNEIFSAGFPITLVPLDATSEAAITPQLVAALRTPESTKSLSLVCEIVSCVENWIAEGHYFAWDVVAAVLFLNPEVAERLSLDRIRVETDGFESGRIYRAPDGYEVSWFADVKIDSFEKLLVEGLSRENVHTDG